MQPQPKLHHQNMKEDKISRQIRKFPRTNGEQFHKFDHKFPNNNNFIIEYGCTHGCIDTKIVITRS
jgi:hypothetical protein